MGNAERTRPLRRNAPRGTEGEMLHVAQREMLHVAPRAQCATWHQGGILAGSARERDEMDCAPVLAWLRRSVRLDGCDTHLHPKVVRGGVDPPISAVSQPYLSCISAVLYLSCISAVLYLGCISAAYQLYLSGISAVSRLYLESCAIAAISDHPRSGAGVAGADGPR